jgi:hypothetical protein
VRCATLGCVVKRLRGKGGARLAWISRSDRITTGPVSVDQVGRVNPDPVAAGGGLVGKLHQKELVLGVGLNDANGQVRHVMAHRQQVLFDQEPFAMTADVSHADAALGRPHAGRHLLTADCCHGGSLRREAGRSSPALDLGRFRT